MCLGCFDKRSVENSVQEPLAPKHSSTKNSNKENRHRSDDIGLSQSPTSQSYEPPTTNSTPSYAIDSHEPFSSYETKPPLDSSPVIESDNEATYNNEAIPPMGNKTTLTGWLHYKTGTIISTYQRAFFILEEGFIYAYSRPKSGAVSSDDMVLDPIDLAGAVVTRVALPDRQFCIDIENLLFLDAYSSPMQKKWIEALDQEIDDVSYEYLLSGEAGCKDTLALWYGKMLGRREKSIIILQQPYVVKKHFVKAGFHRCHDRIMNVDGLGERIVWSSPEGKDKHAHKDDNKAIALNKINEVVSGATTHALHTVAGDIVRASRCFTVYASDRDLDVEMKDVVEKTIWVKNLNEIIFIDKVSSIMSADTGGKTARKRRSSAIERKAALREQIAKNTN